MTNIKSILKIVLPLLLGIVLVWFSFSKISFSELLVYFKNANYAWIILGVGLGLLSHLSRAYRWKFMLEPLGYDIKFRNSIMAVFSTYLINYTIPRAGEVARASILTNYEGVPFEKGFGTIVAERLADMLVLVVIIGITLFLEFEFIYDYLFSKFDVIKILIGLILFLSFLTIIIIYVKKGSSKIAQKIKVFFNGLVDGMLSIFKMEKKWPFIAHTIFIWVMYVLMFYVTTFAVPELNNIPFAAVLVGFISASFSIAATNGGIGSYPVAVYLAFSIFGVAEDPSIAFGWIIWTSQTLMVVILGGLSLIYLPIFNRQR